MKRLDAKRRLSYHKRFVREVAESSPRIEVVWNLEEVRISLRLWSVQGGSAGAETAAAVADIFSRTGDEETRRLCLNALYRINHRRAKSELLGVYRDPEVDLQWRTLSAELLRLALREGQSFAPQDGRAVGAMGDK